MRIIDPRSELRALHFATKIPPAVISAATGIPKTRISGYIDGPGGSMSIDDLAAVKQVLVKALHDQEGESQNAQPIN
jgi:hypothetical protein